MDPRQMLRDRAKGRTLKALAAEADCSISYLSDVLNERREPAGKLLEYLGVERVITYRARRRVKREVNGERK